MGAISLRAPSRLVASVSFSFALAMLTVASVAIPHRRGPRRAYWTGFATCGWLYLVLTGFPILDTHVGVHLLTTPGLDLLYQKVAQHRPILLRRLGRLDRHRPEFQPALRRRRGPRVLRVLHADRPLARRDPRRARRRIGRPLVPRESRFRIHCGVTSNQVSIWA